MIETSPFLEHLWPTWILSIKSISNLLWISLNALGFYVLQCMHTGISFPLVFSYLIRQVSQTILQHSEHSLGYTGTFMQMTHCTRLLTYSLFKSSSLISETAAPKLLLPFDFSLLFCTLLEPLMVGSLFLRGVFFFIFSNVC